MSYSLFLLPSCSTSDVPVELPVISIEHAHSVVGAYGVANLDSVELYRLHPGPPEGNNYELLVSDHRYRVIFG